MVHYLRQRRERLRQLLEEHNLDAVIASSTPNVYFLTGQWINPHERLLVCIVRRNGDDVILAPELHKHDFDDVEAQKEFWSDGTDTATLLAKYLPSHGKISIDDVWPSHNLIALMRERPGLECINSRQTLGVLRRIKDEQEIGLLRQAGHAAARVMSEIIKQIRPGVQELELVEELRFLWNKEGMSEWSFDPIVGSGKNGALPHHTPDNTVVQSGDMVVIDMGGSIKHYCSDITRTVVVGMPTAKQLQVYEIVKKAQAAGASTCKPGVPIGEVDCAARAVIENVGYGQYFFNRTGHGLGIEVHEEPYVFGENTMRIEPGMVFTVEPGIYIAGQFGIRIEDTVLITDTGCESLNPISKELVVV